MAIVHTMVRLPWSSKPKQRKEEVKSRTIRLTDEEVERYLPSPEEIRRLKPPVKRLWTEKGILEQNQDKEDLMFEKIRNTDQDNLNAKARSKIAVIEEIIGDSEFHDRTSTTFVFDLFARSWGTEVMINVWWAGWDDILVTTMDDAFLVEIQLGPMREVKMSPKYSINIGGKGYVYFKQKGLVLPDPELRLGDSILHLLFVGVFVPEGPRTISSGATEKTGNELIALIKQQIERMERKYLPRSGGDLQAPKL